jgi:hypothetical protein
VIVLSGEAERRCARDGVGRRSRPRSLASIESKDPDGLMARRALRVHLGEIAVITGLT